MATILPNLWSSCVGVTECGGPCPLVKVSVYTINVDKGKWSKFKLGKWLVCMVLRAVIFIVNNNHIFLKNGMKSNIYIVCLSISSLPLLSFKSIDS